MIQAWSSGALKASPKLHQHLDNCLLCRSCENVCPAQVPYGQLVDNFRVAAGKPNKNLGIRLQTWASRKILANAKINKLTRTLLERMQQSKIQTLFEHSDVLNRIKLSAANYDLNKNQHESIRLEYRTTPTRKTANIGFFAGCTGQLLDGETIDSALRILNILGCSVHFPKNQVCCGAMDLHAGDASAAAKLAEQNLTAFDRDLDAIVSIASGCGAFLKEYPLRHPHADQFAKKIHDISDFIVNQTEPLKAQLQPLNTSIALHTPCSLNNVMHSEQAPYKLIQSIPGTSVFPLPDTLKCCGAAGTYMLEHPKMAALLRDDLLDHVAETKPAYLATSNIGCALHIKTGLSQRGLDIEVVHPIVLMARQLPST